MSKSLFILCLSFLYSVSVRSQTNLYVDSSMATSGAGTSWSTAFKTINEALAVHNGTTGTAQYAIYIARGTYYPSKVQSSTRADSFLLIYRAGVKLYGGYPSGGGTRNISANPTIVSGNINNPATYADNSLHLLVIAGVTGTDTILVDGLRFTDGTANYGSYNTRNGLNIQQNFGAAVYGSSVAAPLLFSNCSFSHDSASATGGAMYCTGASPIITNCTFTDNRVGGDGGAVWTGNSDNHIIINSTFTANRAGRDGGAVFSKRDHLRTGTTRYSGCTFSGNTGGNSGGAVYEQNIAGYPALFDSCNFNGSFSNYGGALFLVNDSTFGNAPSAMRQCNFTANRSARAGGAMMTGHKATLYTMDSCIFTGNVTGDAGGGLYLGDAGIAGITGQIRHCRFSGDSASQGGGLFNAGTVAQFSDCVFQQNTALNGGGIFNNSPARDTFYRCVISGNRAHNNGGGMTVYSSRSWFALYNCLIAGNVAGGRGGGVYDSISFPTLINCTLANDTAASANGIANVNVTMPLPFLYSASTLINCIVWEGDSAHAFFNRPAASGVFPTYSIIEGGLSGTGNTSANPLFVAPLPRTAAPTTGGNYHLSGCSPAINAGISTSSYSGVTDLDGAPRLYGANVDQGAYEYQNTYPTAITGDTGVCVGKTVQLGNATAGGVWSSSNTSVAAVNATGLVVAGSTGIAVITYTIGGACPATVSRIFTVSRVDNTVTMSGATLQSAQAGAQYQWLDCAAGHAPLPGETGNSFTPAVNGQYAVAVTLAGCTDTSACISVSNVGVQSIGGVSSVVRLYPNPAHQRLSVSTGKAVASSISLSDMAGRRVLNIVPDTATTTLDLAPYAPGLYLIEVWNGAERYTGRVEIVK